MVDIPRVGPGGQKGPDNVSGKKQTSAEKFEEMMKKVQEVEKTEPDEKKKRKRREEQEDEELTKDTEGAPTPASQVTPFNMTEEEKKVSPLGMQTPTSKAGPLSSAQPLVPPAERSPYEPPISQEGMEGELGVWEEEAFMPPADFKGAPPKATPPRIEVPQTGLTPTFESPEIERKREEQRVTGRAPEVSEGVAEKKPKRKVSPKPSPTAEEGEKKTKRVRKAPKEIESPAAPVEGKGRAEQKEKFFEEFAPKKVEDKAKLTPLEEAELAAEQMEGVTPVSPTPETTAPEEKKDEEKEVTAAQGTEGLGTTQAPTPDLLPPITPTIEPYAYLHPQVLDLFERMAGVMTVMNNSGITETTITLNAPQFASSVFFGTQIIIQEYSTAPKAYNIQLLSSPQGAGLLQSNAEDLMASFQSGNYNFRVNRLDTGVVGTDKPLFRRKEEIDREKKDQGNEQQ